MKNSVKFFSNHIHLLAYGVLLTFLSGFGQTFLIALYLPSIQNTFQISDAGFSAIYAAATLLSAFSITWLGRFIDKVLIFRFTVLVLIGLSAMLLLFSQVRFVPMLFVAIYGLRLFGQGLLSHTSVTAMARFFDEGRGKAISIASLGHPLGEMLLPIVVVSAIYAFGWRCTVMLTSGLVALAIPVSIYLLKTNLNFSKLRKYVPVRFSKEETIRAKPLKILRSKIFWILMPSTLASGSIGTGFLLFKLKMGLVYSWSPTFVAVGFTLYAMGNALANVLGGILSDRYSGKQLFPFYLLPAILGVLCLTFSTQPWVYIALVGGIGFSNGLGGTLKNVTLAELYGIKIIGSVRSLFITVMIFSTALGPFFFGLLLDAGISYSQIALFSAVIYSLTTLNSLRILKL